MSIEDTLNYVKYARDVASASWHTERRLNCLARSDELQDAIRQFERTWSREDLIALTGAFTRCYQAVELIIHGETIPTGRGCANSRNNGPRR